MEDKDHGPSPAFRAPRGFGTEGRASDLLTGGALQRRAAPEVARPWRAGRFVRRGMRLGATRETMSRRCLY